jgi:hypothetical protein
MIQSQAQVRKYNNNNQCKQRSWTYLVTRGSKNDVGVLRGGGDGGDPSAVASESTAKSELISHFDSTSNYERKSFQHMDAQPRLTEIQSRSRILDLHLRVPLYEKL